MHAALVDRPGCCIRRLAGCRSVEMRFWRFLHNDAVSAEEMVCHAVSGTGGRVTDRDIVVVHDTSELVLGGQRARANGYGPVGKGGGTRGLLLHGALALDAKDGALIGLADAKVWNRDEGETVAPRRSRVTVDKESQRWLDTTARAGEALAAARSITAVSDRESDMFEHFAARPADVHLIVRACQNRKIKTAEETATGLLFAFIDGAPEAGRFETTIPAAPGRKKRLATLAMRFAPIELCKPLHGAANLPATIALAVVDVREISVPEDSEPIHWRLLTTHAVSNLGEACRIIDLYRLRWTIEEFFRLLKTAGFDIENADISDPATMIKFVAAATIAAVSVMQLVKARDGTTDQTLTDAFAPDDQPVLEALSAKLEGDTARQKNPHPKGTLAFAAWTVARLGGWIGYYGKPGPR